MTAIELNAVVRHREDLTERLAIVKVAPQGWTLPAFQPGQYATLGLSDPENEGQLLRRVYSIASAPGEDHLEFFIQLVKEGEFTQELWPLGPGAPLFLSPKIAGRFTLQGVPPGQDLVLVGTGTGLAPFVSMVRHEAGTGRWRRCVVVHGARTAAELGYRGLLEGLAAEDPSLVYVPVLSREAESSPWAGLRGRVQCLLEGDVYAGHAGEPLDPARCHVFLCGHPGMIDDMEQRLAALGFRQHTQDAAGNLHFERYW